VWEEHLTAVECFLRCQTQWRVSTSGVVGLDYSAVRWIFRLYGVKDHAGVLEDLQIMEAAAVQIINERGSK